MPEKEQKVNNESACSQPHQIPNARLAKIRDLNDRLRTTGRGGIVQMTNGVAALGFEMVKSVFVAIEKFTDFNPDNDPWASTTARS